MTNTIGIVHSGTKGRHDKNINHLKSKLDGQVNLDEKNIYWAEDDLQKLATYAAKLVTDSMDLIVAAGGSASANAVKGATEKRPDIKVVCTSVSSSVILAPNMAGICVLSSDLDAVRLELLHEYMEGTMPGETKFGALFNSSRPKSSIQLAALNAAAHAVLILTHRTFTRQSQTQSQKSRALSRAGNNRKSRQRSSRPTQFSTIT